MKKFILALVFILSSTMCFAGTYWVDTSGGGAWVSSDTDPGPGNRVTLDTANANAVAGDIINLISGSYSTRIQPVNSGADGNPIIYQAAPNNSPKLTNTPVNAGAIYLNGVSYIKVMGITVESAYRLCEIANGSNYNEIANCTLYDGSNVGNSGIVIRSLSGGAANTNNWVHDNTIYQAGYISDTCNDDSNLFKIGTYNEDYISEHNTVENNHFYWGGHHTLETYTQYNVIRNNFTHNEAWMEDNQPDCDPAGAPDTNGKWGNRNFQIYDGNDTPHMYNLIEGNRIGDAGPPPDGNGANNMVLTSRSNILRYNVIFNAGEKNIHLKQGTGANSSDNRVYNNTAYKTRGIRPTAEGIFCSDGSLDNVIKNNIITASYGNDIGLKCADGNILVSNMTNDPHFVNTDVSDPFSTTVPDLSLRSDSSAIDAGSELTQTENDGADSTTLVVSDALYFQDGTWGSALSDIQPDWIAIGTVSNVVQIASIDYDTNTITLASPATWATGDKVWLYKKSDGITVLIGSAPDIGAEEYSGSAPPVISKQLYGHSSGLTTYNGALIGE